MCRIDFRYCLIVVVDICVLGNIISNAWGSLSITNMLGSLNVICGVHLMIIEIFVI